MTTWYWTDHQLYALNFFDRQLKPFFDRPDRTIDEMLPLPLGRGSDNFRYLVLALDDGIEVLDEQGRPVFERAYLHDPQQWDSVEVAINPAMDRLYFQSQPGFYNAGKKSSEEVTYLDELDLPGDLLHSYNQTIDNRVPPEPRWLMAVQAGLLPVVPAVVQHFYRDRVFSYPGEATLSFAQQVFSLDSTGWMVMILLAVVLAAVAFAWARRVGFATGYAWSWAVFVLAFGPAGWLTFRLAADWPERVRCPFCGHPRSLDQNTCPHCQRPWEAPPPSGTEILQPLALQS